MSCGSRRPCSRCGTCPPRGVSSSRRALARTSTSSPAARPGWTAAPSFASKSTATTSLIAITYNVGAICGGLIFGTLSGRLGRRKAIALAAGLSLLAIPFWAYAQTAIALATGAFLMQFLVQGAWGVVPAHLNELAPEGMRATFPGVVYQLGNLIASRNSVIQADIAGAHGGGSAHPDYSFALAVVAGTVAVLLVVLALAGPEKRDVRFGNQ